jgi:ubiquinone/menaquinone biosynthesis C-methylase UbiE/membrane-associated phospholipid phosphatase
MKPSSPEPDADRLFRRRTLWSMVGVAGAWVVLAAVFGFTDLPISEAVTDLDSPLGAWMEVYSGFPGLALILLALLMFRTNLSGRPGRRARLGRAGTVVALSSITLFMVLTALRSGVPGLHLGLGKVLFLALFLTAFWSVGCDLFETWGRDFSRRFRGVSMTILSIALFVYVIAVQALKGLWGRVRFRDLAPGFRDYTPWWQIRGYNGNTSFASEHVVLAWILLALVILVHYRPRAVRVLVLSLVVGWALMVGAYRVIDGRHYASDVLFSSALTILVFLTLYACYGPPLPPTDGNYGRMAGPQRKTSRMPHKFDPAQRSRLFSEDRRKRLPAGEILETVGLKAGDVFVDIGCGPGFFALPAARTVGASGRVIGLDVSPEMIADLQESAAREGLHNVEAVLSTEITDRLPRGATVYFMANVLHELADPRGYIRRVRESMAPGSRLAIVDYEKRKTEHGPPVEERFSLEEVRDLLQAHGLSVHKTWRVNAEEYGLLAGLAPAP